ncbi:MAG: histidine kinase [Xanthomonadales bacterium]|jgi:two-component system sensor histidine kinase DesK|nr:histidine kinase [Xanthomonadales bacterium]
MSHPQRTPSADNPQLAMAAQRPTLYLVYLVFFFLPMLFRPLDRVDWVVAALAVALFLPLHYLGFNAGPRQRLVTIAGLMVLASATAPFVNGNSVFLIYAVASAGFLRPMRLSMVVFVLCAAVYVAGAAWVERHPLEMAVAMLLAIIIWFSCYSSSESIFEHERAERARALDLQQASLIERERIARDLHDLLGHTLTLVSLKADLVERLMDSDPDKARTELRTLQAGSREALADVRSALSGLTATTIRAELENAAAALGAAGVALTVHGNAPILDPERESAFGLMLREAVTNIIRHSSATQAEIRFALEDGVHSLEVTDNGEAEAFIEGNGLTGLRRRLEQIGGMLSVHRAEATGVQLRAMLPQ